jgi:demethylmenaquinone methyltransferase/2-methoxy-6-polyprenyl-1,4-benzoquinol methylase
MVTDADELIRRGLEGNPLREPLLRRLVHYLRLPVGSRGLDVASGLGLQARLLAEAVGPNGHVTGLDRSPELVRYAEDSAKEWDLSDRLCFQTGNAFQLPYANDTFDWIWSSDFAGYPVGDLLPLLREFSRVVKPGGTVAILAWSSQNLLPGYELLEARLNATCSAYLPYFRGTQPETHFARALGPFHDAGLDAVEARSFTRDVQVPLKDEIRTGLISLFEMLWGERQPEVTPEDWEEYLRLCRPGSPGFVLDLPDYHASFTYLMFRGSVPGQSPHDPPAQREHEAGER